MIMFHKFLPLILPVMIQLVFPLPLKESSLREDDEENATTESSPNVTNFVQSAWHKILNVFGAETTTATLGFKEAGSEEIVTEEESEPYLGAKPQTASHRSRYKPVVGKGKGNAYLKQDTMQGEKIERFKHRNLLAWKTEKIVEASDPVESIDSQNYIKEANQAGFPYNSFSAEPIIVQDNWFVDD